MSTSYYLKPHISYTVKNEMHEAINNNDFELLRSLINENADKIFIGIYSSGWKFKFNCHNFEYYDTNIESLYEFLKSGIIEDEYGNIIPFEDFIKIVQESTDNPDNIDLIQYYHNPTYKKAWDRYYPKISKDIQKYYKNQYNIDVNELGEFYIEKFRFGVDDD